MITELKTRETIRDLLETIRRRQPCDPEKMLVNYMADRYSLSQCEQEINYWIRHYLSDTETVTLIIQRWQAVAYERVLRRST